MSQRDHGIENVMRRNLSPEISDLILYMKAVLAKQWLCLHTILQEHAKANHTPYFFLFVFVIIFLILLICVLKLPTFQGNYAYFVCGAALCTALAGGPTG